MTAKRRQEAEPLPDLSSSPSPSSEPPHLAAYGAVVERATLTSVRLVDLTFRIGEALTEKPSGKLKVSAFYNATLGGQTFNVETGVAVLTLNCGAGAKRGKKAVVDCKAKFLLTYIGLEGCDQDAVTRFLARVGRFAGYPYFRSLFATLSWNAETAMPPLPVLREVPRKPLTSEPETSMNPSPKDSTDS